MATPKTGKPKGMTTREAIEKLVRTDVVKAHDGSETNVYLCKLRDIPMFLEFMTLILDQLALENVDIADRASVESNLKANVHNPAFLLKLISKNANKVFEIVAAFTDKNVDALGEMDIDDALAVGMKVVEVNYTFFTVKILPMLQAEFAARLSAMSQAKT